METVWVVFVLVRRGAQVLAVEGEEDDDLFSHHHPLFHTCHHLSFQVEGYFHTVAPLSPSFLINCFSSRWIAEVEKDVVMQG